MVNTVIKIMKTTLNFVVQALIELYERGVLFCLFLPGEALCVSHVIYCVGAKGWGWKRAQRRRWGRRRRRRRQRQEDLHGRSTQCG